MATPPSAASAGVSVYVRIRASQSSKTATQQQLLKSLSSHALSPRSSYNATQPLSPTQTNNNHHKRNSSVVANVVLTSVDGEVDHTLNEPTTGLTTSNTNAEYLALQLPPKRGDALSNVQTQFKYNFTHVLSPNSSNADFYSLLMPPEQSDASLLHTLQHGYNRLYMTYGQVGTAKTYTLYGDHSMVVPHRGIVPRFIHQLYRLKQSNSSNLQLTVGLTYVEVYNETLIDLLPADTVVIPDNRLREAKDGTLVIKGLSTVSDVQDEQTMHQLILHGQYNRHSSKHTLNQHSSRGHTVCTLTVKTCNPKLDGGEHVTISNTCFIDLSGFERSGKAYSSTSSKSIEEVRHTSSSLAYLEQVVSVLQQQSADREFVPYRSSKLTQLLRPYLSGSCGAPKSVPCHTSLLTHVYQHTDYVDETLTALRFSQKFMTIRPASSRVTTAANGVTAATDADGQMEVNVHVQNQRLQREVLTLRNELQMQKQLQHQSIEKDYLAPLSDLELQQTEDLVQRYIYQHIDMITIESVRQVNSLLTVFRQRCQSQAETISTLQSQVSDHDTQLLQQASMYDQQIEELQAELNKANASIKELQQQLQNKDASADEAIAAKGKAQPKSPRPTLNGKANLKVAATPAARRASVGKSGTKPGTADDNKLKVSTEEEKQQLTVEVDASAADNNAASVPATPAVQAAPVRPTAFSNDTEALQWYQSYDTVGSDLYTTYQNAKQHYRTVRRALRDVSLEMNTLKQKIENLQTSVQCITQSMLPMSPSKGSVSEEKTNGDSDVVNAANPELQLDEEDYAALQQLQQHKQHYTQLYHQRSELQTSVAVADETVEREKVKVATSFLHWYNINYNQSGEAVTSVTDTLNSPTANNNDSVASKVYDLQMEAMEFAVTSDDPTQLPQINQSYSSSSEDLSAIAYNIARRAVINNIRQKQQSLQVVANSNGSVRTTARIRLASPGRS